jgi:hypothetical protein
MVNSNDPDIIELPTFLGPSVFNADPEADAESSKISPTRSSSPKISEPKPPLPPGATFTQRQVQMLPICITRWEQS